MLILHLPLSSSLCSDNIRGPGQQKALQQTFRNSSESHQDLRRVLSCPSAHHSQSEDSSPGPLPLVHVLLPLLPSPVLNPCLLPAFPALHSPRFPFVSLWLSSFPCECRLLPPYRFSLRVRIPIRLLLPLRPLLSSSQMLLLPIGGLSFPESQGPHLQTLFLLSVTLHSLLISAPVLQSSSHHGFISALNTVHTWLLFSVSTRSQQTQVNLQLSVYLQMTLNS